MKLKWTDGDGRRAEQMGWNLWLEQGPFIGASIDNRHFKTDREAVDFVIHCVRVLHEDMATPEGVKDMTTCHKAILICCLGGAQ